MFPLHCSSLLCWPLLQICCVALCVAAVLFPLLFPFLPPLLLAACCAVCAGVSFAPVHRCVSSVRLCCQCVSVAIPGLLGTLAAMLGGCVVCQLRLPRCYATNVSLRARLVLSKTVGPRSAHCGRQALEQQSLMQPQPYYAALPQRPHTCPHRDMHAVMAQLMTCLECAQ